MSFEDRERQDVELNLPLGVTVADVEKERQAVAAALGFQ